MHLRRFLVLTPFFFSTCAFASLSADNLGRRYELNIQSSYSEGCLDGLCMCPIALHLGLKGSFQLRPDRGLRDFAIERVEFTADSVSGLKNFVGGGRYIIDGRMHRMTLELSNAGGDPIAYDSGWVERPRNTAGIVIELSMVETTCWGDAFAVQAQPYQLDRNLLPPADRVIGELEQSFGTVKARW